MLVAEKGSHKTLRDRFREGEKTIREQQTALGARQQVCEALEAKLNQMTEALTNLSARFVAADVRARDSEAQFRALTEAAQRTESQKRLLAELPTLKVTNHLGKVTLVFPKLLKFDGSVLATNAEYRQMMGRRAVFMNADGSGGSYDVDELHPAILRILGINVESAKRRQVAVDRAWAIKDAVDLRSYALRQEKAAERQQEEARQREEQARLAGVQRQSAIDNQLRIQAIENDSLRAAASMRAADAAMAQALYPSPGIQFNQQINPAYPGTRGFQKIGNVYWSVP
jgi:hypothetical protein